MARAVLKLPTHDPSMSAGRRREANQEVLQGTMVGDDAIVNNNELVLLPRRVGVRVHCCWLPVGCPSRVPDSSLRIQHLYHEIANPGREMSLSEYEKGSQGLRLATLVTWKEMVQFSAVT